MFLNLKQQTLFSSSIVMQMDLLISLNLFKSFCLVKIMYLEISQLIGHQLLLENLSVYQEILSLLLQLSLKKKLISKEELNHWKEIFKLEAITQQLLHSKQSIDLKVVLSQVWILENSSKNLDTLQLKLSFLQ